MSEVESAQNLGETEDESANQPDLDNSGDSDDNSIRALLQAQLAEGETESESESKDGEQSSTEGDAESIEDNPQYLPAGWSESERELWGELPQPARDAIERQEKAANAKIKSDAELQKVIEPLAERLKDSGVHVDKYLQQVLQADQAIASNPLQAVLHIAQRYNVLDQLKSQLGITANDVHGASENQASQSSDEIAQLRQEMAFQAEVNNYAIEWNKFISDNPDAESLSPYIAAQMQANPAYDYAEAYKAVKADIGEKSGGNAANAEAEKINAATQAAEKARRLNLPKGKTGNIAPVESTGSLRDDLKAAAREQGIKI